MTDEPALESTSVTDCLVLYELAELDRREETPAGALTVLERCRERIDALDDVLGGRFTEAELVSTCRSLGERGLVTEVRPDDTSPVGKGRPSYELAVDPQAVREAVSEDDRLPGIPTSDG